MNLIIRLLITAAVAYGLTYVLEGVNIADFKTAIIFSLVLGLLNAIVKPHSGFANHTCYNYNAWSFSVGN